MDSRESNGPSESDAVEFYPNFGIRCKIMGVIKNEEPMEQQSCKILGL